jgi:hypothetical protein
LRRPVRFEQTPGARQLRPLARRLRVLPGDHRRRTVAQALSPPVFSLCSQHDR